MRPPRTGLHLIRRSSRPAAAGTVVAAALEGAGSGSGGDDARCNAPRTRQGSAARDPVLRSGSGRAVRGAVSRRGARRSHSPEVRMVACDLAGVGFEHRVEHRGVFRVPAPDQESQLLQPLTEVHRQVPGLLGDPAAGRVGRHAGDMQLPGRMPAKISTYKRLSSTCRCAGSHRRLSGAPVPDRQELTPGRAATPRRGAGPCQLQDFPPGRVRDRVTEPVKLALDPAVTSARVCPGHRNDELLDRRSGRWAAAGRRWG